MTDKILITLYINGRKRSALAHPRDTLLTVLRDGFGLTGTKRGCDQGVCGTCTVSADGTLIRACLLLAATAGEQKIVTIEGLHASGAAAPIAAAFAEAGAVQCGFCTSGMIISAEHLLRETPGLTRESVQQGMSANLCRCTGYKKIIDAVCALGAMETLS